MQIKPITETPASNNGRKQAEGRVFGWRKSRVSGSFGEFGDGLLPVAVAALNRRGSHGSQAEHAAQLMASRTGLAASCLERQIQMQRYGEQDEDIRSCTVSLSA
ncbi:hypothetical protein [Roseibium aggregatum]|uniref:Uncharacterized protein n=1 Tax=Roseibium aggregatum TaxID=187304 RepID=A0A939J487_9HYPH|nr:hypothetical protein [Roseibium aggregatum]MBN9673303.1 hypothetical protein [Roseibium aggregatum]